MRSGLSNGNAAHLTIISARIQSLKHLMLNAKEAINSCTTQKEQKNKFYSKTHLFGTNSRVDPMSKIHP